MIAQKGKHMEKLFIEEESRRIPVIDECDVLVCGGGAAGCAAALAAARNGARVIVLEKNCTLGGLATTGLISCFLPLSDGSGKQVIGGIAEEFFRLAIKYGPGRIPDCWEEGGDPAKRAKHPLTAEFNPHWLMIGLEQLVLEAGVKLYYDTKVCAVRMNGGAAEAIIVENKNGRGAVSCRVVIDATGDADICAFCGEETVSLDSNRRAAWFHSLSGGRLRHHILGDIFFLPVPEGSRTFSGDDCRDITDFCIDMRRQVYDDLMRMRSREETSDAIPTALPVIPLMRKTRRLKGQYELSENDRDNYSEAAIGMTSYYRMMELHLYFPYPCLIGKTSNLLTAGRCISSKEEFAWNITRGIPSSSVTGQAAGTAAAICAREGISVQELDGSRLRKLLIEQGAIVRPAAEL